MSRLRFEVVWRQITFLLLAPVFYLRFSLPSPVTGILVYGWVSLVVLVTSLRVRRFSGRAAALAGALASAYIVPVGVLWLVRGFVPGHFSGYAIDANILTVPYYLVPAIVTSGIAWGTEVVYRTGGWRAIVYPLIPAGILVMLFAPDRGFSTALFGHPVWYGMYTFAFLGSIVLAGFSAAADRSGGRVWTRPVILLSIILLSLVPLLLLLQQSAVPLGGGLIEPTMFRFDFSDLIRLESKIQLGDELVLVYHEENPPPDRLLRRFVLAGYDGQRGFFRTENPVDAVPAVDQESRSGGRDPVSQEYYLVNFDPDAVIAVNEPVTISRMAVWDRSSFNAVYHVESLAVSRSRSQVKRSPWPDLSAQSQQWRDVYTTYSGPEPIADLAREITANADGYYQSVLALQNALLERYSYSLSPGVAEDGDQLSHFLFESRKGYCSYFAFSMVLMARSLGIPARVAAGFFINPESNLLHYYPIRANMAHAWVEVYFDESGWVEFDPTSRTLAEGETLSMDQGMDPRALSNLVEEILRNRSDEVMTVPVVEPQRRFSIRSALAAFRRWIVVVLAGAFALRIAADRVRYAFRRVQQPAARIRYVFRRTVGRLYRYGIRRRRGETLAAFAARCESAAGTALAEAVRVYQKARCAPAVTGEDALLLERALRETSRSLRRGSWWRWAFSGVPAFRSAWRTGLVLLVLALVPRSGAFAQTPAVPAYEDAAWDAIDAENYEQALRILDEAQTAYPDEPIFPLITGDLFFDRELYNLAEQYYRTALDRGADDLSTSYALASTLGRLNRTDDSILVLERLYSQYDPDIDVIADLGWSYFKVHRLPDAISLVTGGIEELGLDRYLSSTLATVYAASWDYENARDAYRWAIENAQHDGDLVFVSVGEYNLSILEAVFYRYADAFEAAQRSVAASERSSGYLIRGELYEQQVQYAAALADYERGGSLDTDTPLVRLNIASLLLDAGYPERARGIIDSLAASESDTWLYNYGTDLDRYTAKLYGLRADIYHALSRNARINPGFGFGSRIRSMIAGVRFRVQAWYFRGIEREAAIHAAAAYDRQGQELNARWTMLELMQDRPVLGKPYLERARELETALVPLAAADYELLAGVMSGDREALGNAYTLFDPEWEAAGRAKAIQELMGLRGFASHERAAFAALAFHLNPGIFTRAGIRFPVRLETGPGLRERAVAGALRRRGFRITDESPFVLDVRADGFALDGSLAWRLLENGDASGAGQSTEIRAGRARPGGADAAGRTGTAGQSGRTAADPSRRAAIRALADTLADELLRYRLPLDQVSAEG